MGPGRRRDKQWSPNAHPLRSGRGPSSASPNSMRRKPPHPDAEGIADDGGDENGEHQRPAAKIVTKVNRISTVAASPKPAHRKQSRQRKFCALLLVLDVTYDGFAYMGDKVIERPVFFLASVELAFHLALSFWSDFHSVGWSILGTAIGFHSLPTVLIGLPPALSFRCRTSCTDRKPYPSRNRARVGLR